MPKYELRETGPVIAEIIRHLHEQTGRPVHTDDIRAGLLSHPRGRTLVMRAHSLRDKDDQSPAWFSMAILASFAQSVSRGRSPWARQFVQSGTTPNYSYVPR